MFHCSHDFSNCMMIVTLLRPRRRRRWRPSDDLCPHPGLDLEVDILLVAATGLGHIRGLYPGTGSNVQRLGARHKP